MAWSAPVSLCLLIGADMGKKLPKLTRKGNWGWSGNIVRPLLRRSPIGMLQLDMRRKWNVK
jgi:hypothetical protein